MVVSFTWIDWIILLIVVYFAIRGWTDGVLYLISSLLSFFLSLYLAIRLQPYAAPFVSQFFDLSSAWAGVLSYVVIAFVSEAVLSFVLHDVVRTLPRHVQEGSVSQFLGALLSAVNGFLIVTFFLVLLMALPVRGTIKQNIEQSRIAQQLLVYADRYAGGVRKLIENSAEELSQFLTIKPDSSETIRLNVNVQARDLSINVVDESQMVNLINQERTSRGIQPVIVDTQMRGVARAYSKKMFLEKFFSHYDADGHDSAYRLQQAGVQFFIAGENLAFAPSLKIAHLGLMNSEGHRRNILDPAFRRVGIGIIDGGIWGNMVTQEFAD